MRKRMLKYIVVCLFAACLALPLGSGCAGKKEKETEVAPPETPQAATLKTGVKTPVSAEVPVLQLELQDVTDEKLAEVRNSPRLQSLTLIGGSVSPKGWAALKGMNYLETVDLSACPAQVVSLKGLPSVEKLELPVTVKELELEGLMRLEILYLMDQDALERVNLRCLTRLKTLELMNRKIVELRLEGMPELESLHLTYCKELTDISPVPWSGLTGLKTLDLTGCKNLSNAGIACLSGLTRLETLRLSNCNRVDGAGLASLRSLTALKSLDLSLRMTVLPEDLAFLPDLPRLRELNFARSEVRDAALVSMENLPQLEVLDLSMTRISDEGLKSVQTLGGLKSLNLSYCNLTDAGLDLLAQMKSLKTLDISHCSKLSEERISRLRQELPECVITYRKYQPVSEAEAPAALEPLAIQLSGPTTGQRWKELSQIKEPLTVQLTGVRDRDLRHLGKIPMLRELGLGRSQITDAGLKNLESLTKLEWLLLYDCSEITDSGLAPLSGLSGLKTLKILLCKQITDAGLAHLAGLGNLEQLDLSWSSTLTDAGLEHLSGLKGLKTLQLRGCTQLTEAGIQKLQAALPECEIRR